jgi:hypothetical protein
MCPPTFRNHVSMSYSEIDRDDHLSPRSRVVGHPMAPFLTIPQIPTVDHGMGSPLEPAPNVGLQAPWSSLLHNLHTT